MTLLHAYFAHKNQQAFQRLLQDGALSTTAAANTSTSGGKSWTRSGSLSSIMSSDINGVDWLGRTVLHLACSSLESIEYVRILLRHPAINVNIPDAESHWTPLHRALYHANIPAAILLLQRTDTDTFLKDIDGYTAIDLYNSTIHGTKPERQDTAGAISAELFTWGANRNASLGMGDGGDRLNPEHVIIPPKDGPLEIPQDIRSRFSFINARQIQMSRLHTAVITTENNGNLRLCGFGNGGRLGPGQHTQYSLKSLPITQVVVAVALGQDHTLALTNAGEVLSWGLNRFSQLGYIIESDVSARPEELIQTTPRKIPSLKKEYVKGVAASKSASACWTSDEVFTWGTNGGQLGYDKATQPVQILPRRVTKITGPVIAISMTDTAMACLLEKHHVILMWNDRHTRIQFPDHAFPSEIQPYLPPQAIKDTKIAKVTSCDDTFAALASNGELFIFSAPSDSTVAVKPQRVVALRKQFSPVRDVALGADGSIIICTESGHVFVRSRNAKAGQGTHAKTSKFQRIAHIQRVTHVCANSTGAFGALRVEFKPKPIEIRGNTLAQDLRRIQPYLVHQHEEDIGGTGWEGFSLDLPASRSRASSSASNNPLYEESDDRTIENDIEALSSLCNVVLRERTTRQIPSDQTGASRQPHGADICVRIPSGATFLAHRVVLAARSSQLYSLLCGSTPYRDLSSSISLKLESGTPGTTLPALMLSGCHAISVLILLHYLYSDEVLAIWDRRIYVPIQQRFSKLKLKPDEIRKELQALARILDLPALAQVLQSPVRRTPVPSMSKDLERLFQGTPRTLDQRAWPLAPDVILRLADRDVLCHSVVLRARSEFFSDLFGDEAWTKNRWNTDGTIVINLKHLHYHEMEYVLLFLCCGHDREIFDGLDFVQSLEELLDFIFNVVAAANEFLVDRLILFCSDVILQYANIHTACYILAEATHFHAQQLVESIQGYMVANMDALLESRMLDDMPPDLTKRLALFAHQKQLEKSPHTRSNHSIDKALEKHADWLAMQDIPEPIIRENRTVTHKNSVRMSPPATSRRPRRFEQISPTISPIMLPQRMPVSSEDIFSMDEPASLIPPEQPIPNADPKRPMAVWKASSVPRADMKMIMAEAATTSPRHPGGSPLAVPQNVHRTSPSPSMNTRSSVQQNTPPRSSALLQKPPIAQPLPRPASKLSPSNILQTNATPGPSSAVAPSPSRAPPAPRGASPKYPGLGPVIKPMRQAPAKSPGRNISGGKVWSSAPEKPVIAEPPSSSGAMSFAAIQQLQLDQGGTTVRDKRSLVEIQEEERARQTEEEFLRWWAEEEQRIQLDAELAQAIAQSQQQQRKQPKGRKPIRKKKSVQPSGQAGMSAPPASRGPAVAVNSKDVQK